MKHARQLDAVNGGQPPGDSPDVPDPTAQISGDPGDDLWRHPPFDEKPSDPCRVAQVLVQR
jgi:hypothetical protein